ncbi:MAG TPA: acylneuraminate cytidylyltransferase family protein [Flavobacterium sp.]|jgi:N-acylneuraminate cytidylyltransferase
MKTIAIIPARGGSKRLPGKNSMLFGKIPLVAHSILYAKANPEIISDIYVSTDDARIKEIAIEYGAKIIDRPSHLSGDPEPTVTALKHVLENIEPVENVVLLQATNPLRPKNLLKEAFEVYAKKGCDSLFTVSKNHQKLGKIKSQKFVPFNYEIGQRTQDIEPLYFENGLLYISKVALIKSGKIISPDAFVYQINHIFGHVDIDTLDDFEYAEYLLVKFSS